jgi:hypothetical protein
MENARAFSMTLEILYDYITVTGGELII